MARTKWDALEATGVTLDDLKAVVPDTHRIISEHAFEQIKYAADRAHDAERERDEAVAELERVREDRQRQDAFRGAGIDLHSREGQLAAKVYQGELTAEAVREWIGGRPLERAVLETLMEMSGGSVDDLHAALDDPWPEVVENEPVSVR